MSHPLRSLPFLILGVLSAVGPSAGQPTPEAGASPAGQVTVAARLRAEGVDQRGTRHAFGTTLRTLLRYETPRWQRWSVAVAAEDVSVVGDDTFDNAGAGTLANGRGDRAVIADVELTEIDEAFVRFDSDHTRVTIGRQEVNLADERLVGAVGWRQNHQSFDALRVDVRPLGSLELTYAYLDRVHRIFGDRRETGAHYLQVQAGSGALVARAYGLDLSSAAGLGPATRTLGFELTGALEAAGRSWTYELELAHQDDRGGAEGVDADYAHLVAGTEIGPVTARLGLEVLEGGPGRGRFSTPLATLHKFNGWADKFLQTPASGLEDAYLSLAGGRGRWRWAAVAHRFRAESAPLDLGNELDGMLSFRAPWNQSFGLKVARYRADRHATDTTKWMLWSEVRLTPLGDSR